MKLTILLMLEIFNATNFNDKLKEQNIYKLNKYKTN